MCCRFAFLEYVMLNLVQHLAASLYKLLSADRS